MPGIVLFDGIGVRSDTCTRRTVKHRNLVTAYQSRPNLWQVQPIHREPFTDLAAQRLAVASSDLAANITTAGYRPARAPVERARTSTRPRSSTPVNGTRAGRWTTSNADC